MQVRVIIVVIEGEMLHYNLKPAPDEVGLHNLSQSQYVASLLICPGRGILVVPHRGDDHDVSSGDSPFVEGVFCGDDAVLVF